MARFSHRSRTISSVALAVLGGVLLFAGTIAYYAREQLIDQHAFGDRAVVALQDDGVRHLVSREIVVNLVDRGSTDLVAARPLLESVVDTVVQTQPFQRVFRGAAVHTNRVFFVRERGNALFDLGDAAQLVQFALRSVSPKLANKVPRNLAPHLLTLRRREFAGKTLALADNVRMLGILLPLLALVAVAASVVISPDRRVGLLRGGVAVGASGALLAVTLLVLRARTLAGVIGADEVTDAEVRDAVAGLLDAYLADLLTWALLLALLGLVVAGAAAARDRRAGARDRDRASPDPCPSGHGGSRRCISRLLRSERTAGAAAAARPNPRGRPARARPGARDCRRLRRARRGGARRARRRRQQRNSAPRRHGRRVDRNLQRLEGALWPPPQPGRFRRHPQLVLGGGQPGLVHRKPAPHRRPPAAGRHPAVPDRPPLGGRDEWKACTHRLQRRAPRSQQGRQGPAAGAAQGRGTARGTARGWRSDREARRLALPYRLRARRHPHGRHAYGGSQVPRQESRRGRDPVHRAVRVPGGHRQDVRAGGARPLRGHTGSRRAAPHPRSTRATKPPGVVFTEKDADGTVPWYLDGFSFVQDTPLGAKRREQLSCKPSRGTADSPLFMLNHWADVFPPQLRANRRFLEKNFILERAHRCARERGLPVNLIAVDFYDQGGLLAAVDALNAERLDALRRAGAAN